MSQIAPDPVTAHRIGRPVLTDAPDYCAYFFSLAPEADLLESLENSRDKTVRLLNNVPASMETFRYAPDKWTIRMVFSHITECERLYSFYAACYSRQEHRRYELLDQNWFAAHACTENRSLHAIGDEFLAVRESTLSLFRYLTDDMLDFKSTANPFVFTPRSLGWMACGHNLHHIKKVEQVYLGQ